MDKKKIKVKSLTMLGVEEEASRCLLCHDAPCSSRCPAKISPDKFIRSLRFRNFKGAIETIRKENVLGSLCSIECPAELYCQAGCTRAKIDTPVSIKEIQRYLMDYEETLHVKPVISPETKDKIALNGATLVNMVIAGELRKSGYNVTLLKTSEDEIENKKIKLQETELWSKYFNQDLNYLKKIGINVVNNGDIKSTDYKFIYNQKAEGIQDKNITWAVKHAKIIAENILNGLKEEN